MAHFHRCIGGLIGSLLGAGLFWSAPVWAQLSISPLVLELDAERGQARSVINVGNRGDTPFRARIYAVPFTYDLEQGFQELESSPADLTPYLQFSPTELVIAPGVQRRVRLLSRFPPSLPDGEYRAALFTETLSEQANPNGVRVAVTTRIGVTVYVRKGDLEPQLTVEAAHWQEQPQQIRLLVGNQGEASARLKVEWQLTRQDDAEPIATGAIQETGIITQSERYLPMQVPHLDQLAPGHYSLSGELIWGDLEEPDVQPFQVEMQIPHLNPSNP